MRESSAEKVQEKHMSQSFIYGCKKKEIKWKKMDRNIILCWRCYRESRVTDCLQFPAVGLERQRSGI
jgi:hypothetical protein